ncbi:MAG: cation:proton antiporter [Planctomycetota bacterium]
MRGERIGRWIAPLALTAVPVLAHATEGAAGVDMTHRMMLLAIQVGLILFCAKFANNLFEKLKLPGALGELSIGAIIGPFALGAIAFYGFPHGLFPTYDGSTISPELNGLATIASIVLLFNIGLETDLKLLLRYSVAGGVAGLGGLVVSFAFGAGVVVVFSEMLFGKELGFLSPPCLMLGTITTATSVGITARILSEKRKLDSPEGVTVLSAAVIDDVMGIILLALVTAFIQASKGGGPVDWGHIGVIAVKAVGVWLAATAIGLAASRKISVLLKLFRDRTTIAVMALGLALILAGLFEEAGLAMIVGAYVMGLSLSQADISHVIQEKLGAVYALLVPVFFCVTGMRIDIRQLIQPSVLLFGFVYAVLALASKVIGCGLPAMLIGFNLRGAARIGFGMAPRCEVALIIAGIAISKGLLLPPGVATGGEQILAAVIIMILVNTVIAPPVLVGLFRNPAPGVRREAGPDRGVEEAVFTFPTLEMAEFFVGKLNRLLENEGFFSHCIDRSQQLYQLRKDKAVIDFRRDGTRLVFQCQAQELPLVDAVMYESLAALEQTLRGLRKPLDATSLRTRIQQTNASCALPAKGFDVRDWFGPEAVIPELQATDKPGVIDELLDRLDHQGKLQNRDRARAAVWEREESLSTGLQFGVAIPHARTDAVHGLVCAIGIKHDGIDFQAVDGQPSRIFVLTLSPESRPSPYLQFMSMISRILDEAGRERILAAETAPAVHRAFAPVSAPGAPAAPARAPAPSRPAFDPEIYINRAVVRQELISDTKEGVIRELIDLLADRDLVTDATEAARVVLAREEQLATGLEAGIALPHARTDTVSGLVCAIGLSPNGIDFGGADGADAQVVVLVLTPTAGEDPYLQFVAWTMTALGDGGSQRLLAAPDDEAVRRILLRRRS